MYNNIKKNNIKYNFLNALVNIPILIRDTFKDRVYHVEWKCVTAADQIRFLIANDPIKLYENYRNPKVRSRHLHNRNFIKP